MSDLIDRQAAIDAIMASASKYTGFMEMEMYTADDAVKAIEIVPAAQPMVRAHWIFQFKDGKELLYCSNCKEKTTDPTSYCSNCGAKMEEYANECTSCKLS